MLLVTDRFNTSVVKTWAIAIIIFSGEKILQVNTLA